MKLTELRNQIRKEVINQLNEIGNSENYWEPDKSKWGNSGQWASTGNEKTNPEREKRILNNANEKLKALLPKIEMKELKESVIRVWNNGKGWKKVPYSDWRIEIVGTCYYDIPNLIKKNKEQKNVLVIDWELEWDQRDRSKALRPKFDVRLDKRNW